MKLRDIKDEQEFELEWLRRQTRPVVQGVDVAKRIAEIEAFQLKYKDASPDLEL